MILVLLNIVAFKVNEKPIKIESHMRLHRTLVKGQSIFLCLMYLYTIYPTLPSSLAITLNHAIVAFPLNYFKFEQATAAMKVKNSHTVHM